MRPHAPLAALAALVTEVLAGGASPNWPTNWPTWPTSYPSSPPVARKAAAPTGSPSAGPTVLPPTATETTTISQTETQTVALPTATETNAECVCQCRNSWTGSDCNTCDARYNASLDCGACAAGRVLYPVCTMCTSEEHCSGRAKKGRVRPDEVNGTSCVCDKCQNQWTGDKCETCPQQFAGSNCDECASGYVDYKRQKCRQCTNAADCNGNAGLVTSDQARENCICQCRSQWSGTSCGTCPSNFNPLQSAGGDTCASCAAGHYKYPLCAQCTIKEYCNNRATHVDANAAQDECLCTCSTQWTGNRCEMCPSKYGGEGCDRCAAGRVNYPSCTLCQNDDACSGHASKVTSQGAICICTCRNKWTWANCSYCDPIYDDSKANDCGACAAKRVNYPVCTLCTSKEHCNNRATAVVTDAAQNHCLCTCDNQWSDQRCGTCPKQYSGADCHECATGHIKYPDCRECTNDADCSGHAQQLLDGDGSISHLVTSDRTNQWCVCACKNQWRGRNCSVCPERFNESDDCSSCSGVRVKYPNCYECSEVVDCNNRTHNVTRNHNHTECICACRNYWTGASCATCPHQYGGDDCDSCAPNYYGRVPDCFRVTPGILEIQAGRDSFVNLGIPLSPPPAARVIDISGKQITSTGERSPPLCKCAVLECGLLGSGCKNASYCVSGPIPKWGEDVNCTEVSSVIVELKSQCDCINLTVPPQPDELARQRQIVASSGLEMEELNLTMAWFRPRYYQLVITLLPLDLVNGSYNDTLLPPQNASVPLHQPCCEDQCGNPTKAVILRDKAKACIDCPVGLVCDGSPLTKVQSHYWRPSVEVLRPVHCQLPHCNGTVDKESLLADGCQQGGQGVLCGECVSGHRLGTGGCSPCWAPWASLFVSLLMIAGMLGAVLLYVYMQLPRKMPNGRRKLQRPDAIPQYFKILTTSVQILGELKNIDLNWGSYLPGLFDASSSASEVGAIPSPVFCLFPDWVSLEQLTIVWILFPVVLAMEAGLATLLFSDRIQPGQEGQMDCIPMCHHCSDWGDFWCDTCTLQTESMRECGHHRKCPPCKLELRKMREATVRCLKCARPCNRSQHSLLPCDLIEPEAGLGPLPAAQVFVASYLVLIHVGFTVLTRQLTKPFVCVTYLSPEEGYVKISRADARTPCDGDYWLHILGLAFFFVYGLGFPILYAMVLSRNERTLSSQRSMTMYGFLYINYRKQHFYWESVVLLRKVLVVLAVSWPTTTYSKAFAATWVLFIALALNLSCQPYRDKHQQLLDDFTLFASTGMLLSALWLAERDSSDDPLKLPLLIIVASINTLGLVAGVILIGRALWHKSKHHGISPGRLMGRLTALITKRGPELDKWVCPTDGSGPTGRDAFLSPGAMSARSMMAVGSVGELYALGPKQRTGLFDSPPPSGSGWRRPGRVLSADDLPDCGTDDRASNMSLVELIPTVKSSSFQRGKRSNDRGTRGGGGGGGLLEALIRRDDTADRSALQVTGSGDVLAQSLPQASTTSSAMHLLPRQDALASGISSTPSSSPVAARGRSRPSLRQQTAADGQPLVAEHPLLPRTATSQSAQPRQAPGSGGSGDTAGSGGPGAARSDAIRDAAVRAPAPLPASVASAEHPLMGNSQGSDSPAPSPPAQPGGAAGPRQRQATTPSGSPAGAPRPSLYDTPASGRAGTSAQPPGGVLDSGRLASSMLLSTLTAERSPRHNSSHGQSLL
eukprot:TRINITY_DN5393_c0_g1_i1.p1 TRINITY_DN5393_c0_g1~~TRINITY_DN5393_c0_g1_i1.p1  ORF type:complete len:1731 (+),score=459.49 TRINITY_DN5393_c0_g1_i1:75-5195(+)